MAEVKKPKSLKVSNMYGRARRIAFAKKCAFAILVVLAAVFLFRILSTAFKHEEKNVNFEYLRSHMESRGFSCQVVQEVGGKCVKQSKNYGYTFIRYANGFEYIVKNSAFSLTIRHGSERESKIDFKTTVDAFPGYKEKEYKCDFKDSVVGELGKCLEVDDGSLLDLPVYTSVINIAIRDLNEIIDASGYSRKDLLEKNVWSKRGN